MPECYTHCVLGFQSLVQSSQIIASQQAFIAGANGIDIFSMYQPWAKNKKPNLPALAEKIKKEHTQDFLITLIRGAVTPLQKSYVLGFVSNYIVNAVFLPFVEALCEKGGPYEGTHGKEKFYAALDSELAYQNYKTFAVPVFAATPILVTDDSAEIVSLLHDSVAHVYGEDIPVVAFSDVFHHNLWVRKMTTFKHGTGKLFAPLLHLVVFKDKPLGYLRSRMQPAPPLKVLPKTWQAPSHKKPNYDTLEDIVKAASEKSALCIQNVMDYWYEEITVEELEKVIGKAACFTPKSASKSSLRKFKK